MMIGGRCGCPYRKLNLTGSMARIGRCILSWEGVVTPPLDLRSLWRPASQGDADLRKRRPRPDTTWHLDEVYLKIAGRMVYPWRASTRKAKSSMYWSSPSE